MHILKRVYSKTDFYIGYNYCTTLKPIQYLLVSEFSKCSNTLHSHTLLQPGRHRLKIFLTCQVEKRQMSLEFVFVVHKSLLGRIGLLPFWSYLQKKKKRHSIRSQYLRGPRCSLHQPGNWLSSRSRKKKFRM
jgi:hypothetical protein